jgi:hypothetical protein
MPGADFMGAKLLAAVQAGQIDEAYVDDAGEFVNTKPVLFFHVVYRNPYSVSHPQANVHHGSFRSSQLQQQG